MSLSLRSKTVAALGLAWLLYAPIAYGTVALVSQEPNPLKWVSRAQAKSADADYKQELRGRVLELADKDGNGAYSLYELAELYKAAGVDVQLTDANGLSLYSGKGGIQANLRDSLDTGALEAAVRAYEGKE